MKFNPIKSLFNLYTFIYAYEFSVHNPITTTIICFLLSHGTWHLYSKKYIFLNWPRNIQFDHCSLIHKRMSLMSRFFLVNQKQCDQVCKTNSPIVKTITIAFFLRSFPLSPPLKWQDWEIALYHGLKKKNRKTADLAALSMTSVSLDSYHKWLKNQLFLVNQKPYKSSVQSDSRN